MKSKKLTRNPLQNKLRAGGVYRREDFKLDSSAVDRHLKELVEEGALVKLAGGLYHHPQMSSFGPSPAEPHVLLEAYLKDNRFLVTSQNAYNSLGVGATQLYNETVVYNHKRHGVAKLGGRMFRFVRKSHFPKVPTTEFLLVDLVNNITALAEDRETLLQRVREKARSLERKAMRRAVRKFGGVRAKKVFAEWLTGIDVQ